MMTLPSRPGNRRDRGLGLKGRATIGVASQVPDLGWPCPYNSLTPPLYAPPILARGLEQVEAPAARLRALVDRSRRSGTHYLPLELVGTLTHAFGITFHSSGREALH